MEATVTRVFWLTRPEIFLTAGNTFCLEAVFKTLALPSQPSNAPVVDRGVDSVQPGDFAAFVAANAPQAQQAAHDGWTQRDFVWDAAVNDVSARTASRRT